MSLNLSNILNGWKNYFIGVELADEVEVNKRAEICAGCPVATYGLHTAILPDMRFEKIQGMYCSEEKGGCGCPLSPAVRSKHHQCPKGLW